MGDKHKLHDSVEEINKVTQVITEMNKLVSSYPRQLPYTAVDKKNIHEVDNIIFENPITKNLSPKQQAELIMHYADKHDLELLDLIKVYGGQRLPKALKAKEDANLDKRQEFNARKYLEVSANKEPTLEDILALAKSPTELPHQKVSEIGKKVASILA